MLPCLGHSDEPSQRISANTSNPNKMRNRCKLSVIAEAVASFREVVPSGILQPYEEHFWPPSIAIAEGRSKKNRQNRNMVAITIDPLLEQVAFTISGKLK